jgi:hypothetical protein
MEVVERNIETMEGPREITADNVQYWSNHSKSLKHSQVHKATQFLQEDLIRYVGDDPEFNSKYTFLCLPLNTHDHTDVECVTEGIRRFDKKPFGADYNWSTYKIFQKDGVWTCNCQGYCTREKRGEIGNDGVCCSHTLALMLAFRIKRFKNHETEQ